MERQWAGKEEAINLYYYRKEREGSRVKSTYVGRGEIAHLISEFQVSSTVVERIARADKLSEAEKTEAALDLATELIQLVTNACFVECRVSHAQTAMEAQT